MTKINQDLSKINQDLTEINQDLTEVGQNWDQDAWVTGIRNFNCERELGHSVRTKIRNRIKNYRSGSRE